MNIIQVGILGIIGAILAVQLKQEKTDVAIYIGIGVSVIIFFGITGTLEVLIKTISEIKQFIAVDVTYIGTLLKMLGITYLAEFSSGICKDAGHNTIATQIEMFAKLSILVLSLPILFALLKTVREFLS